MGQNTQSPVAKISTALGQQAESGPSQEFGSSQEEVDHVGINKGDIRLKESILVLNYSSP